MVWRAADGLTRLGWSLASDTAAIWLRHFRPHALDDRICKLDGTRVLHSRRKSVGPVQGRTRHRQWVAGGVGRAARRHASSGTWMSGNSSAWGVGSGNQFLHAMMKVTGGSEGGGQPEYNVPLAPHSVYFGPARHLRVDQPRPQTPARVHRPPPHAAVSMMGGDEIGNDWMQLMVIDILNHRDARDAGDARYLCWLKAAGGTCPQPKLKLS
jgi:hypothetical protein